MIIDDSKQPPLNSHNTSFANPNSYDGENNTLHLNPGASARKPRSSWKGCMWITLLLVAVVTCLAVHNFLSGIWYGISNPHRKMYHIAEHKNGVKTIEDWSRVVRPLIKEDTPFNIVASVWMRTKDVDADGVIYVDGEELNERRLVEKTMFEGVNLKSKNVLGEVTFDVPTKHFKQENLSNYDLRASFVVTFPKPSPLDHAKKFVSWKPENLKYPTMRKWNEEPDLEDRILDSFGFTIPLIEFHNTGSKKPKTQSPKDNQPSTTQSDVVAETIDLDIEEETDKEESESSRRRNDFWLEFTEGNPVTEYHPYIITRSQIQIVDETHPFKRSAYTKAQKELFERDCRNPFRKSNPNKSNASWYDCHRQYFHRGVFETRIQFQVPDETKGSRTEWAYAPFMDAVRRTSGPTDLVSIPLDRESGDVELAPGEAESVQVTWKISYSGRKQNKAFFMQMMSATLPTTYNMTAPQNELEIIQWEHDRTLGTAGHRIDPDIHPRRSRLLGIISFIINLLQIALVIHYWYSRTSTVFISRLGSAFMATHMLMVNFETLLKTFFDPKYENDSWISRIPLFFFADLLEPLLILKAILRIEIDWSEKKWFPKVYCAKPTHRERASERSESKKVKLTAFLVLLIFAHVFPPKDTYFLTPRIPQPTPSPSPFAARHPFSHRIFSHTLSLSYAFYLTGILLQFILNAKSKRYVGKYKLTTLLNLVGTVVGMLDLSERVVGKGLVRHVGVVVGEVVGLILVVVDFGMAVKWKGVSSTEGSEDGETE